MPSNYYSGIYLELFKTIHVHSIETGLKVYLQIIDLNLQTIIKLLCH